MKLVIQAFQGRLALKENRVSKVTLANRVDKEKRVNRVLLGNRGNMEDRGQPVNKEKKEKLAIQEPMV